MPNRIISPFPVTCIAWSLLLLATALPQEVDELRDRFPLIRAYPETLDFGEVYAGETPARKLILRNAGQGDLDLLKVEFNCGCTLSSLTLPSGERIVPAPDGGDLLGVLKPGESAEMVIEFGTRGLLGEMSRTLKIHSNDPKRPELSLKLGIRVERPFRIEPEVLSFGTVDQGEYATRMIEVSSAGVGEFRVKGVSGLPPHMELQAREPLEGSAETFRLTFRMRGDGPAGYRRHKLRLMVENPRVDGIDFFAEGTILSDLTFRFSPRGHQDTLDLGRVTRSQGADGGIEILRRKEGRPFEVQAVRILCKQRDFVEVGIETIQEGSHYRITVALKPDLPSKYIQGSLLVTGDHPDLRSKKIKFIARLVD